MGYVNTEGRVGYFGGSQGSEPARVPPHHGAKTKASNSDLVFQSCSKFLNDLTGHRAGAICSPQDVFASLYLGWIRTYDELTNYNAFISTITAVTVIQMSNIEAGLKPYQVDQKQIWINLQVQVQSLFTFKSWVWFQACKSSSNVYLECNVSLWMKV